MRACRLWRTKGLGPKRGAVNDLGFVLNQIAQAQGEFREPRDDKRMGDRGAIYGFWRIIGWFASDPAARADFDTIAKDLARKRTESKERLVVDLKEQKEEASARARRAAQARWAKQKKAA